jgi:hypothetical protein
MQWDDSIASLFPKHPRQFEARSALNDDKRQSSDCCGQSLRTIKHVVSLKVGFRSASSQRAFDNTPRLDHEQLRAVSGFQTDKHSAAI